MIEPVQSEGRVRIGPAGWSYPDWKGIVYPAPMPRGLHPLAMLARYFDSVEIDSSFYRPPQAKHTGGYLRHISENDNFRFTAKLWQRFTHQRDSAPSNNEVQQFKDGLAPLAEAGKLGALLVQFPWSFQRTPENRRWLARIVETFEGFPLALEVRHVSWDRREVYKALAERSVAFCNIDQPIFSDSLEPGAMVTARLGYVRLHGRNLQDWFRESAGRDDRYNYLYSPEELKPWVEKVERIRQQVDDVYVITNNHYEGQAVVNAFELKAGMNQPIPALPESLLEHYP